MRKTKILSIWLAVVMVVAALPVTAGLAAEDKPKDRIGPLAPVVTSGDYTLTSYYMKDYQEETASPEVKEAALYQYDIYIENYRLKDSKFTVNINLDNTVDIGKHEIEYAPGLSITEVKRNSNEEITSFDVTIGSGFDGRKTGYDAIKIKIDGSAKPPYSFRLIDVCGISIDIGEHGRALLAPSHKDVDNDQTGSFAYDSKSTSKRLLIDEDDIFVLIVLPDKGYWPVVEGATLYDRRNGDVSRHTKVIDKGKNLKLEPFEYLVFDPDKNVVNAVNDKNEIQSVRYKSGEFAWYVLPKATLEKGIDLKITFKSEAEMVEEITVDKKELEQTGGKVKVTVKGKELASQNIRLSVFDGEAELLNLRKNGVKKDTATEIEFPANKSYDAKEYVIKATLDDGATYSAATATVKVKGIPKKSSAITEIKLDKTTIPHTIGSVAASLVGEDIKDTDPVFYGVFDEKGEKLIAIYAHQGKGVYYIPFSPNTTDKDKVFTIKASLDGGIAWNDKPVIVTQKAKPVNVPVIKSLTANPVLFDHNGGTSMITISGDFLDNKNIDVGVFEGNNTTPLRTVTVTGPGTHNSVFDKNDTNADKIYTVKAKLSDGEWSSHSATVTVKGKPVVPENGWQKNAAGKDVFYKDGKVVTNDWILHNGIWYLATQDGTKSTGWQKVRGGWYMMNDRGEMLTGWYSEYGKKYYLKPSGKMAAGWLLIDGDWFYFDPQQGGAMVWNTWKKVGGSWYYFKGNGVMMQGWFKDVDGKWYYLREGGSGKMVANGWFTIRNKRYRFNASGAWIP